jgi:hypothetical protein
LSSVSKAGAAIVRYMAFSSQAGLLFVTILAFAVAAWAPSAAQAQASIVDTQMEVTTALVQSSLTIEAINRADDAKCRELHARIDALASQGQTTAGYGTQRPGLNSASRRPSDDFSARPPGP